MCLVMGHDSLDQLLFSLASFFFPQEDREIEAGKLLENILTSFFYGLFVSSLVSIRSWPDAFLVSSIPIYPEVIRHLVLPKFSPQKVECLQSVSPENSLKLQNPGCFGILLTSGNSL